MQHRGADAGNGVRQWHHHLVTMTKGSKRSSYLMVYGAVALSQRVGLQGACANERGNQRSTHQIVVGEGDASRGRCGVSENSKHSETGRVCRIL